MHLSLQKAGVQRFFRSCTYRVSYFIVLNSAIGLKAVVFSQIFLQGNEVQTLAVHLKLMWTFAVFLFLARRSDVSFAQPYQHCDIAGPAFELVMLAWSKTA